MKPTISAKRRNVNVPARTRRSHLKRVMQLALLPAGFVPTDELYVTTRHVAWRHSEPPSVKFVLTLDAHQRLFVADATCEGEKDFAYAIIAAIGTLLYCRPITTIPDSVTCHPLARLASRS